MRSFPFLGACVLVACSASSASNDAGQDDADGASPAAQDGAAAVGDASADAAPSDAASATDAPKTAWWQPGTGSLPWQWEIDHAIVTSSAVDMGTGDKTYAGAGAADPLVYDLDGFDNGVAEVSALHALGKKVICYIEVGAAENYRPDYASFPAASLGKSVSGYPTEKYLDIGNAMVTTIIRARIDMCATKGFDGIEPDIDDSYTDDTGFTITEARNVAYIAALSDYAHAHGLAWGLKNGGDGGTPAKFIADMIPHIDFAVVEEPFFLSTIGFFSPALYTAGKAMFVAEYTPDTASANAFCTQALGDHTNAALFDLALDGKTRTPCE
jgi:hypothetical protein